MNFSTPFRVLVTHPACQIGDRWEIPSISPSRPHFLLHEALGKLMSKSRVIVTHAQSLQAALDAVLPLPGGLMGDRFDLALVSRTMCPQPHLLKAATGRKARVDWYSLLGERMAALKINPALHSKTLSEVGDLAGSMPGLILPALIEACQKANAGDRPLPDWAVIAPKGHETLKGAGVVEKKFLSRALVLEGTPDKLAQDIQKMLFESREAAKPRSLSSSSHPRLKWMNGEVTLASLDAVIRHGCATQYRGRIREAFLDMVREAKQTKGYVDPAAAAQWLKNALGSVRAPLPELSAAR